MLEPQITYLASENATPEEIDYMNAIPFDQERQTKTDENSKELDRAFPPILARTSGNSILNKIVNILNDILEENREEIYQSKRRRNISFQVHLKIVEAAETKDPELAWQEMNTHLISVEDTVFNSIGSY